MALARGAVVRPTDFNIPQLQIPFEQIYAQMQQYQLEKDQADTLSSLMPKYLNADSEDATNFRNLTQRLSKATTDAFLAGDTGNAMRTMRAAQDEIKKQWQPGGLANALQSRYDQYSTALKSIEDGTKNNKSQIYGNYFKNQLESSVGKGSGYDPVTGKFNSISAPTISKEVILGDEVDTFLKGWMADKGVQITKSADGMWYNKVTQEQVSPDELKNALGQFYQQPHIQEALGIYGWDRARTMNPDIVRERYSREITGQLDSQIRALDELKNQLNKGNRRQIEDLQNQLNQEGYGLTVDGKAGPKTKAALDDYINSVRNEHNKIRAGIPGQLAGIDPTQFAVEDIKKELTNTYVPKYAYTKRDVDMIANQPAIAQMKIRAQQKMMDGLKATLFAPSATLVAPVATTPMTVGTISQQYTESKKAYKDLEGGILKSMTPQMKRVFGTYNADAYKVSNVLFSAAQAAMKNGKYNPNAFVRSLEQQNIRLSDAEMKRQAMFFADPNNRGVLTGYHDQLVPAGDGMEIAEENFHQYRDAALKSNKMDWAKVAKDADFVKLRRDIGASRSESPNPFEVDVEGLKNAYKKGDPKAIAAVNNYVNKLSVKDQSQIFKSENAINLVLNEKLKPFEDQLLTLSKTNMASLIDYSTMDKNQLAQLGLDKKGKVLLDDKGKPKVSIVSAKIGTTLINGRSEPVILMKTSAMQAPVALPTRSLNRGYVETLVNNIAALGINPNNPGDVVDQQVLDAGAALAFDLYEDRGTGFSAQNIFRRIADNDPGKVGTTILKTSKGTVELQTFVVRHANGGDYLVSTSSDQEAQELRKNPKIDVNKYRSSNDTWVVPLTNGYQGVNDAIMATKADLYRGEVITKGLLDPFNVTRQPSNKTSESGILMGALETLNNFDF